MSSACGNSNEFQERQTTKNSLGAGKLHHIILLNWKGGGKCNEFLFSLALFQGFVFWEQFNEYNLISLFIHRRRHGNPYDF